MMQGKGAQVNLDKQNQSTYVAASTASCLDTSCTPMPYRIPRDTTLACLRCSGVTAWIGTPHTWEAKE